MPVPPARTGSEPSTPDSLIDWDRARSRWSDAAFAAARAEVQRRAGEAVDAGLEPVTESSGWGHAFFCPDHVVPLEFEPARPVDHRCPVDGRRWAGEDIDGGWVTTLNARIMAGMRAGALEGRLSGDQSRIAWVRTTLLRYAEIYRDLPPAGRWVGYGRVTGQSLEEAGWAIGVVTTLDHLGEAFSESEHHRLRSGLLEPLAEHMVDQLMHKIHNIECWHLASLATLGVHLDDDALIALAVDGDHGLHAQFDHGIRPDGWWVEGSAHYHYYMGSAMLQTVRVLKDRRPDLADRDDLRRMLLTPLTLLRPDLSMPAHNDGWHWVSMPDGLGQYIGHYELGSALWDEPVLAEVIARLEQVGIERTSEDALLYGPDPSTEVGRVAPRRARGSEDGQARGSGDGQKRGALVPVRDVHPDSGWAVLHDGTAEGRFLVTKFGPHGGGHGHVDKLQVDLWAGGERLAPDFGSPNYTSPLQGPWYRQTLSHNTVLVGTGSQPRGHGRLLGHRPASAGTGLVDAVSSWPTDLPDEPWLAEPRSDELGAYDGVTLRRTVLWHRDYLIDLVAVSGADERVTWAFHHRGERIAGPGTTPYPLPDPDETWQVLQDVVGHRESSPCWDLEWQVGQVHTRMWVRDPADTRALEARVPGAPPADLANTVLRTATEPSPVFVSVLDIWGPSERPHVTDVVVERGDDGLGVVVQCGDRTDTWQVGVEDVAESSLVVDGTTVRCRLAPPGGADD